MGNTDNAENVNEKEIKRLIEDDRIDIRCTKGLKFAVSQIANTHYMNTAQYIKAVLYEKISQEFNNNNVSPIIINGVNYTEIAKIELLRENRKHQSVLRAEYISRSLFLKRVCNDFRKLVMNKATKEECIGIFDIYYKEAETYIEYKDLQKDIKKLKEFAEEGQILRIDRFMKERLEPIKQIEEKKQNG